MARNQRIFYACQAVCIMGRGATPTSAGVVKGLQSVGMSSTFTLDQVFEMGQIEIYENIEEVADIEVTLEKAIDGNKLIYNLASNGKCKTDVVAATKERCDVYLGVFDDGLSHATGVPRSVCFNSGMYTSSVAYNYSIDGTATESVTLVGNDRCHRYASLEERTERFEMVRHKSIHSICGHLSRQEQEQGALDNIGFLENFLEDLKNEKAPQKDINKFLDIFGIQDCLVKVVESEFSKKIHGIHKNVFIIKHKDTVDDNLVVEMDIQKVGFAGWVSIPM